MVANFSDEPLVIPKSAVLGVAEQVSETLINKINAETRSGSDPLARNKNEALYQKLLEGKLNHLPRRVKNK